jgi:hypothetical protein
VAAVFSKEAIMSPSGRFLTVTELRLTEGDDGLAFGIAQLIMQVSDVHVLLQVLVITSQIKPALQVQEIPLEVGFELGIALVPQATHFRLMSFHIEVFDVAMQLQV